MMKRFLIRLNQRYRRRNLIIAASLAIIALYLLADQKNSTFRADDSKISKQIIDFLKLEEDDKINTASYVEQFNNFNGIKNEFKRHSLHQKYKRESLNDDFSRQVNKPEYLILEYTKFWQQTKFCKYFAGPQKVTNPKSKVFINECPYTNCKFTCDKQKISEADALLFHESDVNEEQYNNNMYINDVAKLHMARPEQLFILWNDEANKVNKELDKIRFNWTLSYRLDSEVSDCAYGCSYKKSSSENLQAGLMQDFLKRKNQALWFVSNCDSKYRINFALDVEKYMSVKIYGQCKLVTDLKKIVPFARDSVLWSPLYILARAFGGLIKYGSCGRHSKCEINEINTSKFYFSFESKNCSNVYITEKFYRMLRFNIIPVVLQPNREFYEKIAPPDSFIHAQDFGFNGAELGKYLDRVANDASLYMKYFRWKNDYEFVHSAMQTEPRRLCELCTRLNVERKQIYYESVSKWFNSACTIN